MVHGMKIFDCTLRESGYQTGWFFDEPFVRGLYLFVQGRGIDYLELGFFHNKEADSGRGIFRYCSERTQEIENIFKDIKNYTKLSAMQDIQRPLSKLLPKKDSPIDAIRIITRSHETDADVLSRHVDEIFNLGYECFINFTSSGFNTIEKNIDFARLAASLGVPVIYFADTESVFTAEYVVNTLDACREQGVEVGMHLHDKNGTAQMLLEVALSKNCKYIDATLLGIGGKWHDGNIPMEYLLNRLGISSGYEMTRLKTHLIQQLIKYHEHTSAVLEY